MVPRFKEGQEKLNEETDFAMEATEPGKVQNQTVERLEKRLPAEFPLPFGISMPGSEITSRFPENWRLCCKIGHFDKLSQINLNAKVVIR